MIQGKIDTLTPSGVVRGWVRDTDHPEACHVQALYAGELVAEAVARLFRRDVLDGGHGHGHHGFEARLRRPLPPGRGVVTMHLPAHRTSAPMMVDIPILEPPQAARVEDMLRQPPGWAVDDVAANAACLQPDANYARLGPARFTDAVFRFVFGRWPSKAENRMNADSLAAGRITPAGLLLECLGSRERADMPPALPGPFDPAFPFLLAATRPAVRAVAP